MTSNITVSRTGDILTITVDLSKSFGLSSSGKTTIIGSSEGNVTVPGSPDMKLGLNVYRKPSA